MNGTLYIETLRWMADHPRSVEQVVHHRAPMFYIESLKEDGVNAERSTVDLDAIEDKGYTERFPRRSQAERLDGAEDYVPQRYYNP